MSAATFRDRLRHGERLLGAFIKTPAYQLVEIAGVTGLDFVVLDAEHAPFDWSALDVCMLAARAHQLSALVRVPDVAGATLLRVLDVGAAGVLAPHASDADMARQLWGATHYRAGSRGYSNSPRAGGYGSATMQTLTVAADQDVVVICQIEDRDGVDNIDSIAAINDIDCLFIGKADLAVSYRLFDMSHPELDIIVEKICIACRRAGKAVGIFLPDVREMERYCALGITMFVIGSDQSALKASWQALAQHRGARPAAP